MAVRLKDIAMDLGLSVVTISKVLRNHPDIAEDTRERVMKRVRELDYQPNLMARSLVTGRSYLIGLVVPGLLHPFFAEIAKSLSTVVGKKGYSLILSSSEENPDFEARDIQQLTARRLDALIIATAGAERSVFERLNNNRMPYVLIDREITDLSANFVGVDDEAAGRLATSHLIELGRRRIAHIRGRMNSTGIRRFGGYRRALEKGGLEYAADLVVARSTVDIDSERMGAEAMSLLLRRRPRPDAVFAYNDPLAIGAMNVILEAGLRVPEDIAMIGCGNLHYDSFLRVPLSSIDQRSSLIGERAAEIALRLIESKIAPNPVSVILEPSLVVRASTGKQSRAAKARSR
ncbi:MAG: LacI family DNA-binding transcriptional regulator [Acidobacteriaceae bacterium]